MTPKIDKLTNCHLPDRYEVKKDKAGHLNTLKFNIFLLQTGRLENGDTANRV